MTAPAIEDLLAELRVPTSSAPFDAAAGLRRLAAARRAHTAAGAALAEGRQARTLLGVVSGWVLGHQRAAEWLARFADEVPRADTTARRTRDLDIDGTLVFACLLYRANHRESAQFWWQLAAGAGNGTAAYCLHLHHRSLGEREEAEHWYGQARAPFSPGVGGEPLINDPIDVLEGFARYSGRHGRPRASTEMLEAEVDRFAGGGIASRPDRHLADRLHQMSGRR